MKTKLIKKGTTRDKQIEKVSLHVRSVPVKTIDMLHKIAYEQKMTHGEIFTAAITAYKKSLRTK